SNSRRARCVEMRDDRARLCIRPRRHFGTEEADLVMSELAASAQKAQDAADALGLDITVREMAESTRTAEEAAAACGVTVGQIVKSLVFVGATSGKPYLLLVSGSNRVNEKGVAAHLGEKLKRPDADAVRALTGYAIGGIPPVGHDTPLAHYLGAGVVRGVLGVGA